MLQFSRQVKPAPKSHALEVRRPSSPTVVSLGVCCTCRTLGKPHQEPHASSDRVKLWVPGNFSLNLKGASGAPGRVLSGAPALVGRAVREGDALKSWVRSDDQHSLLFWTGCWEPGIGTLCIPGFAATVHCTTAAPWLKQQRR